MRVIANLALLAICAAGDFWQFVSNSSPEPHRPHQAIIPLFVMGALAAAASGIAGAAGQKAQADQQAQQNDLDRAMQLKLAKQQIAAQQLQQQKNLLQQGYGNELSSLQGLADLQNNRAAERTATRDSFSNAIAKAYLS